MVIEPDDAHYPIGLAAGGSPPLTVRGDWPPVRQAAVAVVASAQIPAALLLKTHDLAQQWRQQEVTVVSGFQSAAEAEIWALLWRDVARGRGRFGLVKVLARGMVRRLTTGQQQGLATGRLTLLSPFDETVRRPTKAYALRRNEVAARLADALFVPHAPRGSSTFGLVQHLLTTGVQVSTFLHEANADLIALGVTAKNR